MGSPVFLTRRSAAREVAVAGHAARVTTLAERIALMLGICGAPLTAIRLGGPLHDVGKLAVDDRILSKPGPLDPRELAEIRTHPILGAHIIQPIRSLRAAIGCVLHHHERWDGAGYPQGLAGTSIPLEARILSVADAYDAMTSDRPYRASLQHDDALVEVARCAGTQFDPDVAAAFVALSLQRRIACARIEPAARGV